MTVDKISIHAPLAGRDLFNSIATSVYAFAISIHAPLAGRDRKDVPSDGGVCNISIHAPLAGRDQLEREHLAH